MHRFLVFFALGAACLTQTACQRSAGDVWEDTKSAGRQISKGVKTLAGNQQVSRQVCSQREFEGDCQEQDYIPLRDSDIERQLRADGYTPPSSQTPGEGNSFLPGVDSFLAPNSPELMNVFKPLRFDTNRFDISGQENHQIIQNIAQYMKSHPNLYLFIEGHCDKTGSAAYNLALGNRRANAIRSALINEGVNAESLFTISYGRERPFVEGDDLESLRLNRRGEFKLYFYAS